MLGSPSVAQSCTWVMTSILYHNYYLGGEKKSEKCKMCFEHFTYHIMIQYRSSVYESQSLSTSRLVTSLGLGEGLSSLGLGCGFWGAEGTGPRQTVTGVPATDNFFSFPIGGFPITWSLSCFIEFIISVRFDNGTRMDERIDDFTFFTGDSHVNLYI